MQRRLAGRDAEQVRAAFIEAMTVNPIASDRRPPVDGLRAKLSRVGTGIANRTAPANVAGMSVMEFMERLADTEVGQALATAGEAYVSAAINDLAQKYHRYCESAKQLFYNKARAWSVLASFLLAFAINVDAVRLFRTYLHDEPLRQAVIDQQDRIEREMHAAHATLKEAQADSVRPENKAELERVESQIKNLQAGLADLKTMGVPIGYDYYPWCAGIKSDGQTYVDSQCKSPPGSRTSTAWAVGWFLSVLLAGILIGLGAPFWFDLASGLSRSLRLLKAMGVGEKAEKGEEATTVPPTGVDVPPRTPLEAFRTAIAASAASSGTRWLLSPTGEIIKGE